MEPIRGKESLPIYTVLSEVVGWTLDRTADIPKSQRFTFGQRIDNLTLDALQYAVVAIRLRQKSAKVKSLGDLDVVLEQLRALWRLVHARGWISRQQLVFIQGKLDECGRMVGGWMGHLGAKESV